MTNKATRYWLVKSEPYKYPFSQLMLDKQTRWDGVRNFEARNNLRAMKLGDEVLFYHSNEGKSIVGIARVVREAYPDPTAPGEDWSVVDLAPVRALAPLTLGEVKQDAVLTNLDLVRRSRLSVTPVSDEHFARVVRLCDSASKTREDRGHDAGKSVVTASSNKSAAKRSANALLTKASPTAKASAKRAKT
jgi:predicted RNA-binding protein with PUA-like domain